MKKINIETIFLIVSGLSIVMIILFTSLLINFLASNVSKIFTEKSASSPIQKFDIQKFEDLRISKERGIK